MMFAAVHESGHGTNATCRNVCYAARFWGMSGLNLGHRETDAIQQSGLCVGHSLFASFWAMRQSTPVGSTITKSRIPQGLSAGGSTLTAYLIAIP